MKSANQGAGPLTMQTIIKKLIEKCGFPVIGFGEKEAWGLNFVWKIPASESFENAPAGSITEEEYLNLKNLVKNLPRKQNTMLKILEEKLGVTNACLSSYIEFKRQALVLLIRAAAGRQGNV